MIQYDTVLFVKETPFVCLCGLLNKPASEFARKIKKIVKLVFVIPTAIYDAKFFVVIKKYIHITWSILISSDLIWKWQIASVKAPPAVH